MARTDRWTLDQGGLSVPSVDHLSNKSSLNLNLERAFMGVPAGIRADHSMIGLFTNFCRLTDKALREYDAARAELLAFVQPFDFLRISPLLRAVDHMENCIGATHRAALNAQALREARIGRGAPRLTARQEERLRYLRNAIEHTDEKILGVRVVGGPSFADDEPYSLRLANTSMVIGSYVLTYAELVSATTKMHRTIEVIRGTPTGVPGPAFPNATLRTDSGAPTTSSSTLRASDYLKELSRLVISH